MPASMDMDLVLRIADPYAWRQNGAFPLPLNVP